MTSPHFRRHSPKYSVILFLGVAAVSVIALTWMGWSLLRQDRELEVQRLEEKREAAADRVITALERALAAEERKLADDPLDNFSPDTDDYLMLTIDSGEMHTLPDGALLYYPVMSAGLEASSGLYADAEKAEFQDKDYGRALQILQPFSNAEDPAVRAGALTRIARIHKKAGRLEAALEIYNELIRSSDRRITIAGIPAHLVARRACCILYKEIGNQEALRSEAQQLMADLNSRNWRLDRSAYLYYHDQAAEWLGQDLESDNMRIALSETVGWIWQNWHDLGKAEQDSSGRRAFRFQSTSITVIWRFANDRFSAVVAGPDYQHTRWFEPLKGSAVRGIEVTLTDSGGMLIYGDESANTNPKTTRFASVTGLPWDVSVVNTDPEAASSQFGQRRRLMMMGLAMLALLVIAASYLIGRAVSRELAAARLQSDFVSAVSHEFRTPLTSMRQFTEMLVEDDALPAKTRRTYYHAQERATRRLSRLVESLLDFGRMEAGARPYRLERLDVGLLVKTLVEEFKQENESDGILIECSVPPDGLTVNGDREALAQAIWNLLDNAVKYSGEVPVLHVKVEAGSQVAIRIQDRGFGISPSERKHIMRKFVRGSSAKALGIKGTGIGLAMVKHVVDAHGGKILIESEQGKGSTITILFPVGG